MKISIVSFTLAGGKLGEICKAALCREGEAAEAYCQEKWRQSLPDSVGHTLRAGAWAETYWPVSDALIFIGACGIAVRSIAPLVQRKTVDPAVVVMDEKGQFVISLLSGHLGGANALTRRLAQITGGQAVITTATDVQSRFAVDVWAQKNGLKITSLALAREISAAVLAGERIGFSSDYPLCGTLPEELTGGPKARLQIAVSIHPQPQPPFVPDSCILGVGCRRDKMLTEIRRAVDEVLAEYQICPEAIRALATIDLKKDEPGLLAFCEERKLPMMVYSAEELLTVEGDFTPSAFVKQIAGVDNVCERAAVCAGGKRLVIRKQAKNGVTVALAETDRRICFE